MLILHLFLVMSRTHEQVSESEGAELRLRLVDDTKRSMVAQGQVSMYKPPRGHEDARRSQMPKSLTLWNLISKLAVRGVTVPIALATRRTGNWKAREWCVFISYDYDNIGKFYWVHQTSVSIAFQASLKTYRVLLSGSKTRRKNMITSGFRGHPMLS